jgi:hypothetical protein
LEVCNKSFQKWPAGRAREGCVPPSQNVLVCYTPRYPAAMLAPPRCVSCLHPPAALALSPHLTDLSAELDTMRLLSGLMVTLRTEEVCPSSLCIWAPLAMSQTLRQGLEQILSSGPLPRQPSSLSRHECMEAIMYLHILPMMPPEPANGPAC